MKKLFLILLIGITTIGVSNAQHIDSEGVLGGYKFTQGGEKMRLRDLAETMKSNESAYRLIQHARSRNRVANVFGFVGGGLIGWPVGAYLGGGEPNWTLAGVGLAVVFVSISMSSTASKKAKRAVDIYNESLDETSFHHGKPHFNFIAGGNRVGFLMTF